MTRVSRDGLQTALEALSEAPATADEMEEDTDARELLNWLAAEEAEEASCDVADATELVTEPAPPPMIPPLVADAVPEADADDAALSSKRKVGVKA